MKQENMERAIELNKKLEDINKQLKKIDRFSKSESILFKKFKFEEDLWIKNNPVFKALMLYEAEVLIEEKLIIEKEIETL